ncbi:MAG: tyrosine-type recombinase/integrase [Saprospiraceae bacterium]|nr:tyrosine-type recombinase/integrase [Lewinella sp.]
MAKLPKPKFNLRLPKSKTETLISLVFRYQGKRLVYSTGYSIHPKDWDSKMQRPIQQERRSDLFAIKRLLDDLAKYCIDIFIESEYGSISLDSFKEQLDIRTGKTSAQQDATEQEQKPTFLEFIKTELEDMKTQGMRKSSWKGFNRHANILISFAGEVHPFDYEDVDWNFRLELIDWLESRNDALAYGNKTLSVLRQFLERARRKKLHSNIDYQGSGWMIPKKKAVGQKVTLNPEELQRLADLRLFNFADKVRDLFLIGAGTGQRFSDYSRYTPDNFYKTINGIPILSLISQKTDTPAKIPLNIFPWLIPILEKHDYTSPKMSMQKFNLVIKDICKKAKLDDKVFIVKQYIGRKARVEKTYVPKYEEVSSHTCRRSFATNLYRMGYRLAQLMPMTGHATESHLREYIGIDSEQNAEEIAFSIMEKRKNSKDSNSGNLKVMNY